jgi:phage shock protein E
MNIEELVKNKIGTIVDVRTPAEFMGGNVAGSINIPLGEVTQRVDELMTLQEPLILCCASGMRSEQATGFLSAQGIQCTNAGSWLNINYFQSLNA